MIFWIFVGLVGLGLYFLNQNKTEKKDRTVITHKKVIQTNDGEIHIQRTQTIDSVITSYAKQDLSAEKDILKTIQSEQPIKNLQTEAVQQNIITNPINTKKNCPNCERLLPFDSFRSSSKHEDGLTKWCVECLSAPRVAPQSNKKYCPSCKKNRFKTSFYKNSKQPDGLTKWCKTCMDSSKK